MNDVELFDAIRVAAERIATEGLSPECEHEWIHHPWSRPDDDWWDDMYCKKCFIKRCYAETAPVWCLDCDKFLFNLAPDERWPSVKTKCEHLGHKVQIKWDEKEVMP